MKEAMWKSNCEHGPQFLVPNGICAKCGTCGERVVEDIEAAIERIQASLARYEDADEDEVDSEEYQSLLSRLVALQQMQSGSSAPSERGI